jgi:hypothetical protein
MALLTTAQVVAEHPQMVVPRGPRKQKRMEKDAETSAAIPHLPEHLLGPDIFVRQAPPRR